LNFHEIFVADASLHKEVPVIFWNSTESRVRILTPDTNFAPGPD